MYNEATKRAFIRDYTDSEATARAIVRLFDIIETYEEEWGADVCTRSAEQLQPMINQILGLRSKSKWTGMLVLRDYVRRRILEKFPGACDGMMHVSLLGLERLKQQMVSSPLHLQRYLDEVFEPEAEQTFDDTYRCLLWMAYAGASDKDAVDVRSRDVNLDNLSIDIGKETIPIYREALPAFRNVVTLGSFRYKHGRYNNPIYRARVPGDQILRGVKSTSSLLPIRTAIAKRMAEATKDPEDRRFPRSKELGYTEQRLTYKRVWLSGLFYRTYEEERLGIPPDFSKQAFAEIDAIGLSQERSKRRGSMANERAAYYKEDYQRWKLAFFH